MKSDKNKIDKEIIILSCDPGTANFAVAVTRVRHHTDGSLKFKILGTRLLSSPFKDLKSSISFSLKNFIAEIDSIVDQFDMPNEVIVERFQSRGLGGTTIECVNFMIGSLVYHFQDHADIKLVTAAQWKNRANAVVDYKATPKAYDLQKKATPKTEHELDAVMMGIYYAHQLFEKPDFECFTTNSFARFMEYFLQSPHIEVD